MLLVALCTMLILKRSIDGDDNEKETRIHNNVQTEKAHKRKQKKRDKNNMFFSVIYKSGGKHLSANEFKMRKL